MGLIVACKAAADTELRQRWAKSNTSVSGWQAKSRLSSQQYLKSKPKSNRKPDGTEIQVWFHGKRHFLFVWS
jgi:hypothetical protein